MDHDTAMGQRFAFPFCSCSQEKSPHGSSLTHTIGIYITSQKTNRIVDSKASCDIATWRVNKDLYIFFRIIRHEKEELGDDHVGKVVIDGLSNQNYSIF